MLERERTTFHNNGTSSMLTNGREIQERVNSTRDSVSMLKEISILSHTWEDTDTSTSLIAIRLSSRPETEEDLKDGTSINNP
jgi:hypothetical protein